MNTDDLGAQLLAARKERGMSLRGAAKDAEVSLNSYYNAERGRGVRSPTLLKLVGWLDIPVGDLSPTLGVRMVGMTADDAKAVQWATTFISKISDLSGGEAPSELSSLVGIRSRYTQAPRVHSRK